MTEIPAIVSSYRIFCIEKDDDNNNSNYNGDDEEDEEEEEPSTTILANIGKRKRREANAQSKRQKQIALQPIKTFTDRLIIINKYADQDNDLFFIHENKSTIGRRNIKLGQNTTEQENVSCAKWLN